MKKDDKDSKGLVHLTCINGNDLVFVGEEFDEEKVAQNCDEITGSTLSHKLKDLHFAQNSRIVLEKGKEQLKDILKKSKFKKFFKESLENAKEELGLNPISKPQNKPAFTNDNESLVQKRTMAPKMTMKMEKN